MPALPTVSVVIPVRNEIAHLHGLVDAVLAQDYPALQSIYFVDGMSEDGTVATLQRVTGRDRRIRVLHNPQRVQAAGINLAFAEAASDIVIRLDGHASYAPDAVRCSVEALLTTGAGGVGAVARPLPAATSVGRSIVAAHESKFGIGAAPFRQATAHGWVDTVWNGCYWKYIVDRVGPLREDLPRTEDNDFHARLRRLGYGIYLAPTIQAYYQPRQTLGALWQQYLNNGRGIGHMVLSNPQAVGLRHLAPLVLVTAFLGGLVLTALWPPLSLALILLLAIYLLALAVSMIHAWQKDRGRHLFWLPLVFVVLHVGYGLGTLFGLIQAGIKWSAIIITSS